MFTLRSINTGLLSFCDTLKQLIKEQLSDDIASTDDFDIGFLDGSNLVRIRSTQDLAEMWAMLSSNSRVTLLRKPRAAITFPVQISRSLVTFHVSRSTFTFTFAVHVSSLPSGASFHTFAILFASRDAGNTCAPPSIPHASKIWLHGQATARMGERIMH